MNLSSIQLPSQKTWAAGVGGIIAWSISLALNAFFHIDLGASGDMALVTLVALALVKLIPPSKQDVLAHINDEIAQAGVIVGKLTSASDQSAPATPAAKALAAKAG